MIWNRKKISTNKYRNKKVKCNGIVFDSKKEANRYIELKIIEKAGRIEDLTLQPSFELQPKFRYNDKAERSIKYIADFKYFCNKKKCYIVEDVKSDNGFRTEVYRLKRKMLLYKYPNIIFVET